MARLFLLKKKKKLTYEDIAKKLFLKNTTYVCTYKPHKYLPGIINKQDVCSLNHCTSEKQANKLLAFNQLMNIAKYYNKDWKPDWKDEKQLKFYIYIDNFMNELAINQNTYYQAPTVYFKSEEFAEKAIEILGEDVIKLALSTYY